YYAMPPSEATRYGWDGGVDSVSITGNGWTIPQQYLDGFKNNCGLSIQPFEVHVTDPLGIDTLPCFTVKVKDCGLPQSHTIIKQYCCPIPGDSGPPSIT